MLMHSNYVNLQGWEIFLRCGYSLSLWTPASKYQPPSVVLIKMGITKNTQTLQMLVYIPHLIAKGHFYMCCRGVWGEGL